MLTGKHEVVYGLADTKVLQDGMLAKPGKGVNNYYNDEVPRYIFDQNSNTKYSSVGFCALIGSYMYCCIGTGFYVTLQQGPTLLLGIQFTTANNVDTGDPLSITIEGSNATSSALMRGQSWSYIYSVSTGLELNPGRQTDGAFLCLSANSIWYTSYRILVTSVRDQSDSVQYSEVKLFGYKNPNEGKLSRTFQCKKSCMSTVSS